MWSVLWRERFRVSHGITLRILRIINAMNFPGYRQSTTLTTVSSRSSEATRLSSLVGTWHRCSTYIVSVSTCPFRSRRSGAANMLPGFRSACPAKKFHSMKETP